MVDHDVESKEKLQHFLTQWKDELQNESVSPRKRGLEQRALSESSADHESPSAKRPITDVPPLLVVPSVSGKAQLFSEVGKKESEIKSEDLVSKLISDLDELNTIPFFEVQLPREIALIIFGYLSIKELCTCALVSRSWNSLSEDDILWQIHYQKCSQKFNIERQVHSEWKCAVQELMLQRRQVERNWKERICGLSDYQPDDCRVLCCLAYSHKTVLSCYSSGGLHVWNLDSEEGPIRVKQIAGPNVASQPNCCDLAFPWGGVATTDGSLKVVDVEACSLVHTFMDLGTVKCVSVTCRGTRPIVGVAYHPLSSTRSCVLIYGVGNDGSWTTQHIPLGDVSGQSVTNLKLLSAPDSPCCSALYSTSTSFTLHPLHSSPSHLLPLRDALVSCFQCDDSQQHVACAGTNELGYWVKIFDLSTASSDTLLKGHSQPITSLSFDHHASHTLVSGSEDRRVHVYDYRSHTSHPSTFLRGHSAAIRSVQMDGWKVVSGSSDGTLIVWDTRMSRQLWSTHERHALQVCRIDDPYLICGHIPVDKNPTRVDATAENPNICHRRLRGLVRVMDFSVDPSFYTKKLPSICSSTYDEPMASSFNLDLILPYDDVN